MMFRIEEEGKDEEKEDEEELSLVPRRRGRTKMQLHHGLVYRVGVEEEYESARLFDDPTIVADCSVSASMGAMRPLVGKLDMLLLNPHGYSNSSMVKNGMRLLKEEVEDISSYLDDLTEVKDPPSTAKCWMNEARDLSYDMEDYIDSLLFVQPDHFNKNKNKHTKKKKKKKKKKKLIMSHVKIPKKPKWCKQISYVTQVSENGQTRSRSVCRNIHVVFKRRPNKIGVPEMTSEFRLSIQEAIERHHRYQLQHCSATSPAPTPSIGRMLPTPPNIDIVVDGRMNEFIKSIAVAAAANDAAAHQQHLKVVSVVGSGCIGKTTLAKVLYHTVGGQFDCRAFIWVSKNPDIKRLFQDLFLQLHRKEPSDNFNQFGIHHQDISKHLQDKRYLIIIDDLWDASVWDIIKYVFPNGKRGSTIIITTRIEDVALTCCGHQSEHVFKMKPLDDDHSRKLFYNSLFSSEESDFPEQFKEVSNKIVEMCAGLPLATISIARLLVNQQPAISGPLLAQIHDLLRSSLWSSSTSERTRHVLNLSYHNLPQRLKTCLLYLAMYPEGSTIWKCHLVKQWVAEGIIITTREGQDIEETAGIYFDQLVSRGFMEPVYISYSNEVVSCTVHEVVRDLIAQKSAEDNFIVVVDYNWKNMALTHKVRRLSILFGDAEFAKIPASIRKSQVRSLAYSGFFESMPCIGEFKLLRVLNLQLLLGRRRVDHEQAAVDLAGIAQLYHLRYLKIASDSCIKLPNRMRGMEFLETLDTTRVSAVPWDIIHLQHLLHLTIPLDTNLLCWINSLLISDSAISLWSLGKLNCLQDLRVTSSSPPPLEHLEKSMEALGSLLGGHGNLKTLVVAHEDVSSHKNAPGSVIICWDNLAAPPLLQRFEFSPRSCYIFARVPMWMGQLGSLRILKIVVRELRRHGVDILRGLPALTALSLYVQTPLVEVVVFGKAGFSLVKYFKFCCSVPWLLFEADAMPNLQKLMLGFSAIVAGAGEDQHQHHGSISIDHLPGLKEINAEVGAAANDADAVAALRALVTSHPSNPGIQVQSVDSIFYGDKTYSRIYRLPRATSQLTVVPGLKEFDLRKFINEQEILDLFCGNCISCITRRVILRKNKGQTARDEPPKSQQLAQTSGSEEHDPEKIINEQKTHDMYCPNCNSCITGRLVMRQRRSVPIVIADPTNGSLTQDERKTLGTVYKGFVDLMTSLFPALSKSPTPAFSPRSIHLGESRNIPLLHGTATSGDISASYAIGIFPRGDIPTSPNPQAADPHHVAVSVPCCVSPGPQRQRDDRGILKAIVYGGLVESVTSLFVVSAAASSGAKTLDIFILGIASLIGGLPLIFHNIADLRGIQDVDRNNERVGRYWLDTAMALLSYMVFGMLPPVLYTLSFRESDDDRGNKMMAVAAASLFCTALLALGKAHVHTRSRTYIKTLMYYLTIAISSSGLSYVAGVLITRVLASHGIVDEGGASAAPAPALPGHAVGAETSAWASF